jgi:hypothetical protein
VITNDKELQVTLDRLERFRRQVAELRQKETNPENYHLAVAGYLSEIDRMNLEVREYLALLPSELEEAPTR